MCCDQVNIQSNAPSWYIVNFLNSNIMGDYAKVNYGNNSNANVYENIMGSGFFLFKDLDEDWVVGRSCRFSILQ